MKKEYKVPSEAPLIASVFKNRLRRNIGLYSCATLVYIITEINGEPHPDRILIEDTKIDNPYNTYKWAGLTPGAISNPGLIALKAAANPPKTNRAAPKRPYVIPSNLLTAYENDPYWIIDEQTKSAVVELTKTLAEFNIEAQIVGIKKGPVVTMFEILPATGVKLSKMLYL